jgi:hypothetical protein
MVTPSPASDRIAVIVPVAAGEASPPALFFERITGAEPPVSLFAAADARIAEETRIAFERAGATVFTLEESPRGARLARAAQSSSSSEGISLFLFLHADTLLPFGWESAIRRAIASGAVGGAFRLSYFGGGARMRWVAFWANARTAFTRVPYGDQAPFVRRDVYERLGGHPPWPLLDDWDFARRLRKQGRIEILWDAVETSPRRYLERGVVKTVLGNWRILWKARRGEPPEQLSERYRR